MGSRIKCASCKAESINMAGTVLHCMACYQALQARVKELQDELTLMFEYNKKYREENAKLRNVVDAARKLLDDEDAAPVTGGYSTKELREAVACVAVANTKKDYE